VKERVKQKTLYILDTIEANDKLVNPNPNKNYPTTSVGVASSSIA
jgi:hypothetical protein